MTVPALRPLQVTAVNDLAEQFRQKKRRVILQGATGFGKTNIAQAVIQRARLKDNRVLFVVNRIELTGQASRRFYGAGIDHGMVQGQNTRGVDMNVIVASIQTLARRGFPEVDFVIVDECHACAGSKAYQAMFMHYKDLPILGLSATPWSRGLGKVYPGLGPLFEVIVKGPTYQRLIDDGLLVDIDAYAPSEPDLTGVQTLAGDYNEKQLAERVDKPKLVGDICGHWLNLAKDKQTICFATSIPHSKHIVEQFIASGVKAEHIDCYTPEEDRRDILNRLANGNTQIVSNCAVLAEGFDSPVVEAMILARPTKSVIRFVQMGGRVLRPFPGKDRALLLDHSGSCKRLGFPNDERDIPLDDGMPRKSSGEQEKEEPLPKLCPTPGCNYLKPPKVHTCPKCGFTPQRRNTVETEAGQLEKLRRTPLKKISTAEKQIIYAEILGLCRERGWKDGFAYHACKDLFGSPPQQRMGPREPSEETRSLITHLMIKRRKAREAMASVR